MSTRPIWVANCRHLHPWNCSSLITKDLTISRSFFWRGTNLSEVTRGGGLSQS